MSINKTQVDGHNLYTPVEENKYKKHEIDPMETTHKRLSAYPDITRSPSTCVTSILNVSVNYFISNVKKLKNLCRLSV